MMSKCELKVLFKYIVTQPRTKLTRYRFDKVKLKSSFFRLVNILSPEPEKLVSTPHITSLSESHMASIYLTKLSNLLSESSRDHYGKNNRSSFQRSY